MALEVGGGAPAPKKDAAKKTAAATKKKAAPKSKAKPTAPAKQRRRLEPTSTVSSTNTRSLERDPDETPSDASASRELVRQQASTASLLLGSSEADTEDGNIFSRIVSTASDVASEIFGSDESENTTEASDSDATREAEGPGLFEQLVDGAQDIGGNLLEDASELFSDARERRAAEEAEFIADANEAYGNYQSDPDALNAQLGDDGLDGFSDAERYAIAQLASENEEVGEATQGAVREDISNFENFDDIPTDQASQILINQYAGEEETEALGALLEEELASSLEQNIASLHEDGLRGDEQADAALEGLLSDAEDLAATHPALAAQLEGRFEDVLESSADQISDVRRNDDRWYQRAGHAVSGVIRTGAGGLGDGLRFAVRGAGDLLDVPQQLASDFASEVVELQGDALGAGLDALGQDGAADAVRSASDTVSGGIQTVSDISSEFNEDVFIGIGEGVGVAVEGVGEVLANPVGTVQGLSTIANAANPLTLGTDILLNGGSVTETIRERGEVFTGLASGITQAYRDTNDEHGAVAATSHAVFDIVTTVGTGGIAAGGRTATSVASRLGNLGRATTLVDDFARFGDEAGRLANLGSDVAPLSDNLAGLSDNAAAALDNAAGVSDELAGLGDNLGGLGDNLGGLGDNLGAADELAAVRAVADDIDNLRALDDTSGADLLRRTEVSDEVARLRGTENISALLDDAGLGPQFSTEVGGRQISLSRPFTANGNRQSVIAYIEDADGVVRPRSLYRSNSQGGWRSASSQAENGWIGKGGRSETGFHGEHVTDVPIELQQTLHQLTENTPVLDIPPDVASEAFAAPLPTHNGLGRPEFSFAIEDSRSIGSGNPLASDANHIDPTSHVFDNPGSAPSFESGPVRQFDFQHPTHGNVSAHSFPSADGNLEFLFLTDEAGRSWIGQVDNVDSPVNEFGVRQQPVDPGDLTQPAVEYLQQIPEEFRPTNGVSVDGVGTYFDGSSFTNLLPPIREFNQWLGGLS